MVDDADFDFLNQFKWSVLQGYAVRNSPTKNGKRGVVRMHRLLMGLEVYNPMEVDHINNIRFDNRKKNLRVVNMKTNLYKKLKYKNNTSGFKGVWFVAGLNKWRARIRKDTKSIHIGYFKNKKDAALAYNRKARSLFGNQFTFNKI